MRTLIGIFMNLTLGLFLIGVFSLSFIDIRNIKRPKKKMYNDDRISLVSGISQSFLINLTLLSLISYMFPKYGINPKTPLLVFGLSIIIFSIVSIYSNRNYRLIYQIIFCSLAAGSWNVIPGLFILAKSGTNLGMVSLFNNDISNYAGLATEVLDNGFTNNSHYFADNLNKFSELYAYQTPVGLVEFVSATTQLAPWQIMMPVMIFSTGYFSISIYRLVQNLFPNLDNLKPLFISFTIPVLPIFGYITNNYFLGQVIGSAIILQIISVNFIIWKEKGIKKSTAIELSGLLILSIYAYPHVLIPIYLIALSCNFIFLLSRKLVTFKLIGILALTISVACLISFSYIQQSFWLLNAQATTAAGWPLPIFNPVSLFIYPSLINMSLSVMTTLCIWISCILGVLYFANRGKKQKFQYESVFSKFLIYVTLVFWISILLTRQRDLTEYSSWKLFTYLLPIILCVLLPYIISHPKIGLRFSYVMVGLAITFPLSTWEPYYKNQLFTSASFVQAVHSPVISELESINIDLGHFFESMNAAMIIRNPQIYLPGPTYYNKSFDPTACTLVWRTNQNYGRIIPLNESYGLGLGSNHECR